MQPAMYFLQDRSVQAVRAGQGEPLIVLESGLGDDWSSWSPILDALAARSRVIAYSRPGYGESSAVSTLRDIATEAEELRELLRALGEAPPYVLVGHSLGGLIAQAFACRYSPEVAGLVTVDAPHPDQIEYLNRDTSAAGEAYRTFARALTGAPRLENEALTARRGGHFQDGFPLYGGPLVMLSAWLRPDTPQAYLEYRRAKAIEAAARYPQAKLRVIQCAHYIHREQPQAVLEAVDDILRCAR
jgi:pimeloyl-ACP methyl ester carboxylesterase